MFFWDDDTARSWVAAIGLDAERPGAFAATSFVGSSGAVGDRGAVGGGDAGDCGVFRLSFEGIGFERLFFLSGVLCDVLLCGHGAQTLLWVRQWGVWPSAENLHCYYRLRNSYGDFSALQEKPGHFFLSHEKADRVTFVQQCLLYGWDAHLVSSPSRSVVSLSHDGWARIKTENRAEIAALLGAAGLAYSVES